MRSNLGWGRGFRRRSSKTLIPVILLLYAFGVALGSLRQMSPTYDEFEYLSRGYLYLKTGDTNLKMRHPVLLDLAAAAPLVLLTDLRLPLDDPSLITGDFHAFGLVFFWQVNESLADQMIFLARLPKIFLLLLLTAAVYRWGRETFSQNAGLVAMVLAVFDPNLLAHGRLVTPDVGQTLFIFLSVFTWWRFLRQPGWLRFVMAGIALGLAQTAGFPALILYPILFFVTVGYQWPKKSLARLWPPLAALVIASVMSLAVIWAVYGFQWSVVEPLGVALPAPYHWEELIALFQRLGRADLAYFRGEVYRGGKWQFFVIALLIKTPLPTLVLFGVGIGLLIRRRHWFREAALWLLPLVFYGNALLSSLNIGYRHLLPVLPFAFVVAGSTADFLTRTHTRKIILAGLLGWLGVASLGIYPDYLSYFNEAVGGPRGGKEFLVVSDLDWGQDLPGLRDYMQKNGIDEVFLSWFGTTPPEHYGVQYRPLPAWPPRGIQDQLPYHPDYPLPGMYAISAANLMGARLENSPDIFAWFWPRTPQATIGYSIYLYQVPRLLDSAAPPVNVVLSGIKLADLPTAVIENRLHTNDLIPRWFEASQAMIFPPGRSVILLEREAAVHPLLAERFMALLPEAEQLTGRNGVRQIQYYDAKLGEALAAYLQTNLAKTFFISSLPAPTLEDVQPINAPVDFATAVTNLGYELLTKTIEPGGSVQLLSCWRVNEPVDAPLAFFVHLLAPDGSVLAQFDGLGVSTEYWYPGDSIVQVHQFKVPDNLPDGIHWLAIGLYNTDTMARLPVITAVDSFDRLLIEVGNSQ